MISEAGTVEQDEICSQETYKEVLNVETTITSDHEIQLNLSLLKVIVDTKTIERVSLSLLHLCRFPAKLAFS